MNNGCVHIYTGDGKGKSTAATGLATRAAGRDFRVGFYQFMKSGHSGELASLQKLGVEVYSPEAGNKFIWDMDEDEKAAYAELQAQTLERARQKMGEYDLLVLDEAVCAATTGLLPREKLEAMIREKPPALELVLTGRGADDGLIALADYCTEMRMVAHPFEKGVPARRGVEF